MSNSNNSNTNKSAAEHRGDSSSEPHRNSVLRSSSTTPLAFDFSTPWGDQDFQDLAIQALNAATATEDPVEAGGAGNRSNFIGTTSSSSTHVHDDKKRQAEQEHVEEKPSKKGDYEAHTITGAIAPAPTVSRRKKKPKGMPKRPLSAYNVFFQRERINVLAEAEAEAAASANVHSSTITNTTTAAVSFEDLGKIIGRRWKSLSHSERKQYEDLAQEDAERYKSEMNVFQEAKRLRNELTYQPPELHNNNDDYSTSRFSRLSRPPEIKSLPYNLPLRAQFPGQPPLVVAPVGTTQPFNHQPDWARQQPDPPRPAATASASLDDSNDDSDHLFPIPPGTELLLPDPSLGGRERRYRLDYKFYRMTKKDAEIYMDRLASFSSPMLPFVAPPAPQQPPSPGQMHQPQQQQRQQQSPPSLYDDKKDFSGHQHFWQ